MGGASKQQKQAYDEQNAFYQQLSQQYSQMFGQQQQALNALHANLAPILNAGPNQQAYSDAQLASLNTQANSQVANNYNKATQAVQNKFAGDVFVPQGAQQQLQGQIASSAAQQLSGEQQNIIQSGYAQGNANYWNAENALNGQAAMLNPTGYANSANGAGQEVGTTANEITQANHSWMNLVGGVLGGVAGAAVGKLPGGNN